MNQSQREHFTAVGAAAGRAASVSELARVSRTLQSLYLQGKLFVIYFAYPLGLSFLRREKDEGVWTTHPLQVGVHLKL